MIYIENSKFPKKKIKFNLKVNDYVTENDLYY